MKSTITKADLNQFTGTSRYYPHWFRTIVFTDGIKFVAESVGAFWLIDVVASYQPLKVGFQVWTLRKHEEIWRVECSDADEKFVLAQDIEYTDFPEELMPFEMYVQNGVLFLPSEY